MTLEGREADGTGASEPPWRQAERRDAGTLSRTFFESRERAGERAGDQDQGPTFEELAARGGTVSKPLGVPPAGYGGTSPGAGAFPWLQPAAGGAFQLGDMVIPSWVWIALVALLFLRMVK